MAKRAEVMKRNVVLGSLEVIYLPVDSVTPNDYNPNRQSEHDFTLLCRSIAEDGFTQPIVVMRATKQIVDGEHRWRACKALGHDEVPCVLVDMSPEQMRIATLRHNRARGSEDAAMAADVIRELQELGAIDWAADSLMMDTVEIQRMLEIEAHEAAQVQAEISPDMLGPSGHGLSVQDGTTAIDLTADERRAKERMLASAKADEEKDMSSKDADTYRLVLFFTDEEAKIVQTALGQLGSSQAEAVLTLCRQAAAA